MGNTKELVVRLIADASGYDKGVSRAKKDNEDLKKSSHGIGDGFLKGAGAALGFIGTAVGISTVGDAIGAVTNYMQGAIQGAIDMQNAQASTNTILQSGSHVAGLTAKAVDDLSTSLSNQTGVDDDVVRGVNNVLAGYSQIALKAYPAVSQAALDLARRQSNLTGAQFDAVGAAKALGLAMADPAKASRLLRQYNIQLSQSEQDAIATALKHGDSMKAQSLLLADVKKRVDGTSASYRKGAAGGIMAFQTAMNNAQKTIGTSVLPILTQLLDKVVPIATQFAQNLPGAIAEVQHQIAPFVSKVGELIGNLTKNKPLMDGLQNAFASLKPLIGPVLIALGILTAISFAPLALLIGIILGIVIVLKKLWEITEPVRTALGNLFGAIGDGITKAQAAMRQGVEKILELLSHIPGPAGDMARGVLNSMKAADDATRAHTEAMKTQADIHTAQMAMKTIANLDKQRQGILKQLQETKDPAKKHMLEMKLQSITSAEEMQKEVVKKATAMAEQHSAQMKALHDKASAESQAAKDGVLGHIGAMKDQALAKVGAFIGQAVANFQAMPGRIGTALNTLKSLVSSKIDEVKNTFLNGLNAVKGFFTNLVLKLPHINLPHFSITGNLSINPPSVPHLDIKWYAGGGIFTAPSIIGVGEAGPEAVVPLNRLGGMGGGGNGSAGTSSGGNAIFQLDGRTIVRAFMPYVVEELRRSGAIRSQ